MKPTHIAIQDTVLLLDLLQAALIVPTFQLSFTYCITDFVWDWLDTNHQKQLQPYIKQGKLIVLESTAEDSEAIGELLRLNPRFTMEECSVYYVARTNKWPMLTSCKCLYTWVYVPPMQLLNITWLFKQLLMQASLTKKTALEAVDRLVLVNPRLRVECAALKRLWTRSSSEIKVVE